MKSHRQQSWTIRISRGGLVTYRKRSEHITVWTEMTLNLHAGLYRVSRKPIRGGQFIHRQSGNFWSFGVGGLSLCHSGMRKILGSSRLRRLWFKRIGR